MAAADGHATCCRCMRKKFVGAAIGHLTITLAQHNHKNVSRVITVQFGGQAL